MHTVINPIIPYTPYVPYQADVENNITEKLNKIFEMNYKKK